MKRLLFIVGIIIFVFVCFQDILDMLIIIAIIGAIFICYIEGWVKKIVYSCILSLIPKYDMSPGWIKKWVDRFVNMGYVLFTYITGISLDIFIDPRYNLGVSQEKFLSLVIGVILLWVLAFFVIIMYVWMDYSRQHWQKNPEIQKVKIYILCYFKKIFKIWAMCYLINKAIGRRGSDYFSDTLFYSVFMFLLSNYIGLYFLSVQ